LIPSLRRRFNQSWSPEKYAHFFELLARRCGEGPQFRHSETPCFLPVELVDRMARYGREMVDQLLSNPQYERESREAIPPAYRAPNEDSVPLFVQADFGLDENLEPRLVEIQGFPSLYAYQLLVADAYRQAYEIDSTFQTLPGGLTANEYRGLLKQAIVGNHDPETVVLLEIDPAHQKTRHDFVLTEQMFGVRAVDVQAIRKKGNRLYYQRDGKETPIHRIYNRVIADELERRHLRLPFDFRDDLNVEWAGHPNWFFRLSKFSMPYLDHPAAPWTEFLDRTGEIERPEQFVLKPLYSFAGAGVVVGPTAEQLQAIPEKQRHHYVLQQRVNFHPVIETPAGPTKIEVRIMYVWLNQLRQVNLIIRMGRDAQMGVDHNKGMDWVGASAAFIDAGGIT
jgi:hypothetical protein